MKKTTNKKLDNLQQLIFILTFCSLVGLLFSFNHNPNYSNWTLFCGTMVGAGVLVALGLYWLLCFYIPDAKKYKNEKGIGMLAPLVLWVPLFFMNLSNLNDYVPLRSGCKEYAIQDMGEGARWRRRKVYFIFINTGEKIERLSFGKEFSQKHHIGDTVNLCRVTGLLGFTYYKINTAAEEQWK